MSQILVNSLNNLQDVATEALQTKTVGSTSAMDKSYNFQKTFDKTLDKTINKLEKFEKSEKSGTIANNINNDNANNKILSTTNVETSPKTLGDLKATSKDIEILATTNVETLSKTLGDLKAVSRDIEFSQELAGLREVLEKAMGEANTETSLDLSLAKDIESIIAKFKEAIEKAKNDNFNIYNTDAEVESDSELSTEFDTSVVLDEILNAEDLKEVDLESLDLSAFLSQILSKVDMKSLEISTQESLKEFKDTLTKEISSLLDELNIKNEDMKNSLNDLVKSMDFELADEVVEFVAETVKPAEDTATQEFELALDDELLKELNIESVQADASSTDSEAFMQQQSAQEHTLKAMINHEIEAFDVKIDKTTSIQQAQTAPAKPVEVNPSKILNQIVKQMEGMQNGSKVNIVLNPESLGKVNVQLLSTKEGLMAQFVASTPEARDVLMKGLDGLKESLLSHGVSVDNISVKMNETQKSSYQPDWTEQEGSRGGNKEQGSSNKEEKEKGLFEKLMAQANEENGNV